MHVMAIVRGVEIFLHSFLISALDAGEWLTSRPGRFIPRQELRYQLNRRLCQLHSRYGRLGSEKTPLPLPRFETQTVCPVV